jgi:site-specific DNA-methyltransferase (adenine-specific)
MGEPDMIDLLAGDCLEVMKGIPDKSVDMVLCDLPYGATYCKWDSVIDMALLWGQYNRILKDKKCAVVLFGSEPFSSTVRMSNVSNYRYDWVWNKTRPSNFPLAKTQPMRYHENIMVFYAKRYYPIMVPVEGRKAKMGGSPTGRRQSFLRDVEHFRDPSCKDKVYTDKYPSSIIKFSNPNHKSLHTTQKPVDLCEYLIKTYTNEGEMVLDNCAGSGTTGIACLNTGRNCILIEKEAEYCEVIRKRLEEHK